MKHLRLHSNCAASLIINAFYNAFTLVRSRQVHNLLARGMINVILCYELLTRVKEESNNDDEDDNYMHGDQL